MARAVMLRLLFAEPVSQEQKIMQPHLLLKKEHRVLVEVKKKTNWDACQ